MFRLCCLVALAGCAAEASTPDVPDVRCLAPPAVGEAHGFRHSGNKLAASLGRPAHRGVDLIAVAGAESQEIAAELSYGLAGMAAADEDVELFACDDGRWHTLGTARTDHTGAARLVLTGAKRLPIGLRDMYLSSAADRTGARFLAYVAPRGSALVISDVDGTLTSSERAFALQLVYHSEIAVQRGAPAVFDKLVLMGYQPVYVTARPRSTTQLTREWLARVGMPRGPLRLAPHVLLPGGAAAAYKTGTLQQLAGFDLALAIGNRASDITAYTAAGVRADRIRVKLPEFASEVAHALATGKAVGFFAYSELDAFVETLPAR